jgi:hypothetical protein
VGFCGHALNEARRAAAQRRNVAALGMDFMDPAEQLAIRRADLGVAEI